jgi:hypothetical protein
MVGSNGVFFGFGLNVTESRKESGRDQIGAKHQVGNQFLLRAWMCPLKPGTWRKDILAQAANR